MLKVPESCETKMLGMKWRVWQEKILLLMRIRSHDTDTLCRLIYEEGKSRGWPGLGQEVTDICQKLNIPDVNDNLVPKSVVKEAIFEHHYSDIKEEVSKMKKLDPIKDQDFGEVQNYFMDKSIENAGMSFKIRSQILEEIPGNFKNKFKNEKEKLKCQHCSEQQILTQSHCVECPASTEIKKDLDLTKIEDC
jgi:hypothetical protein